ncbi:hypothetical protein RvY_16970 [Ramazzottius varieornatus]|uniref:Uncharacterized protein n=1 Tax=Ramazzottius varieornatus TaxID=947166 RepID=A0A1D1W2X2_RAMVA|nr:hypothetical protein RvY_16970 [Ramazzottius varieornatus]
MMMYVGVLCLGLIGAILSSLQSVSSAEQQAVVCKYLITKKYECQVPKPCNGTGATVSCKETVQGSWSDADDIVHYDQVCVLTDHFTTCTFKPDWTFKCQMVWEQRRHPSGHYIGDARSGFRRVDAAAVDPKSPRWTSDADFKTVKSSRRKRAGGGTC